MQNSESKNTKYTHKAKERMGIGKETKLKTTKREERQHLGGFILSTSFSNSSSTVTEEDQQSIAVLLKSVLPFPSKSVP